MDNKSGFTTIGYVSNLNDYGKAIKTYSKNEWFNYDEFNNMVEEIWDKRGSSLICFDIDGNEVEKTVDNIAKFWIRLDWKEKIVEEEIFAQFITQTPGNLDTARWTGVTIGSRDDLCFDEFKKSSDIPDFESVNRNLCEISGNDYSLDDGKKILADAFANAKRKKALAIIEDRQGKKPPISVFCIEGILSMQKQPIYVKMETNNKTVNPRWYGAFLMDENALKETLLDYRLYHNGFFIFEGITDQNAFLKKLADRAMKEKWRFTDSQLDTYPILGSYIKHTYYRLLDEDNASENGETKIFEYNGKQYFNSGLLDRNFRQIIIVGEIYNLTEEIPGLGVFSWKMLKKLRSYSENDREIAGMFESDKLPKIATYFKECKEVVFDASLHIALNDRHIFEDGVSRGRLKKYQEEYEKYKDDKKEKEQLITRIARDFDSAVEHAKLMAERNYKLAVPQFYRGTGEIQFLLPIYLGEKEEAEKPQCALVLNLEKGERVSYYRGTTILTLDQAYNNTRLLAKPDVFWLNDLL